MDKSGIRSKKVKKGKIITCGIDVGSVSSQGVIMVDGELYCYGNMRTVSSSPDSASMFSIRQLKARG